MAAVLLAWALGDQPLGPRVLLGGALVHVAGVAVVLLEPAEARVTEAAAAVGSAVR